VRDGGVDDVGEGKLRVVERQLEEPAAAALDHRPAGALRCHVVAALVEDPDRLDERNVRHQPAGADERDRAVVANPRGQVEGFELPAPRLPALTLDDREELLGALSGDGDRFPAVGRAARGAVLEAVEPGLRRGCGTKADRDAAALQLVAARLELDARVLVGMPCQRRLRGRRAERLLEELDLRDVAPEDRAGEERCREGDQCEGDECAHGQLPGVCRAIRRPQFFVDRHCEVPAFPRARKRSVFARRKRIDPRMVGLEDAYVLQAVNDAEDHPSEGRDSRRADDGGRADLNRWDRRSGEA
jgi:hypothetical protein